jgi:hypothetical protein
VSTLAGDFWVCGDCRSINNAGAGQCYNCRSSRNTAAVDPADIDREPAASARPVERPTFRSSRGVAVLASVLILGLAAMQVVQAFVSTSLFVQVLDGVDASDEQTRFVTNLVILTLGVAALALIGWALWLSRTVTSMPALGLGDPPVSGLRAFIETFIPVLNLVRVPAIVRDIVMRLDPAGGRIHVLGFAAWVGLLVGFVVPRISRFMLGFGGSASDAAIRSQLLFDALGTVVVVISAVFLVALIWWVEERIQRRLATQRGDAATSGQAGGRPPRPVMAPTRDRDLVGTRPAFAAVGASWAATAVASSAAATSAPPTATSSPTMEPSPERLAAATAVAAPPPVMEAPPVVEAPPAPEPPPVVETPPLAAPTPEPPQSAEPAPVTVVTEPEPEPERPPHLTIRVASRGMMTAELDGQTEHIILDDLTAYGSALSKAGGRASIVVPQDDDMARLIARRAQRILEDAGVSVTTS